MKNLGWTGIGIIVGMLMLSSGPSEAQMRGLGRINGTAVDDAGEPVADVVIRIGFTDGSKLEGKSDGKGNWAVAGLGKGEFPVSFTKDGFETKRVKVVIEKELSKTQPIKITMKKGA